MSEYRIASRYAKSLLELSEEKGVLDKVNDDMTLFSTVISENRELLLMLRNPIVKHTKKRQVLYQIFEGKIDKITLTIIDIITSKNREEILPAIAKEFHNQYNAKNNIRSAKVTTTFPLTAELRKRFESIVKEVFECKGVDLEEEVDESLVGGFVLTVGDRQIDDSVKSKINGLKHEFTKNPYVKGF
ncbi:MAG: ATP synthase F1 subunit delta [Bacteroidota bacterium]